MAMLNVSHHRPCARIITWNVRAQHSLIERAREHRVLWDHTHENFSKKKLKKSAWALVAAGLRQEFPELDELVLNEEDVQAKFGKLKTSFQREVRKINSTPGGFGGGTVSKWEFFRTFSYLLDIDTNDTSRTSYTLPPYSHTQEPDPLAIAKVEAIIKEDFSQLSGEDVNQDDPQPRSNLMPTPTPSPTRSSPSPTASSSSASIPLSTPAKKRKRISTASTTEQLIEKTMCRVNDILSQNERGTEDIADKTAELVRNFLSVLSKPKKTKLSMKIINLMQEESITENDIA